MLLKYALETNLYIVTYSCYLVLANIGFCGNLLNMRHAGQAWLTCPPPRLARRPALVSEQLQATRSYTYTCTCQTYALLEPRTGAHIMRV